MIYKVQTESQPQDIRKTVFEKLLQNFVCMTLDFAEVFCVLHVQVRKLG